MSAKISLEECLNRFKDKHGDRYVYDKVVLENVKLPVEIFCRTHGLFFQAPQVHFRSGCPKCAQLFRKRHINTESFINKCKAIHNNKYSYEKTIFVHIEKHLIITCPIHGDFSQIASVHSQGHGCTKCKGQSRSKGLQKFIQESSEKHGNKYDYSLSEYSNNLSKLLISCPHHGVFRQRAQLHLNGSGCPKCAIHKNALRKRKSIDTFINQASLIHDNKYDYSYAIYENNRSKIEIKCKEHGSFFQSARDHLRGRGCPFCRDSMGEKMVTSILKFNSINFESEKRFDSLVSNKGAKLIFDFFIPDYNLLIEFDGVQHKTFRTWFYKTFEDFQSQKDRDNIKNTWAKENKYNLIRLDKIDEKYMIDKLSLFIPSLKSHTTDGSKVETP